MRKRIGECLMQAGLITETDLRLALDEHRRTGERLGAVLIRTNLATEKQITKAVAYQLGFPYVNLADELPDPAAVVLIPKDVALKRVCIAVKLEKNQMTVAMSDPLLFSLVQDLEFQTGYRIKQVVARRTDILSAIERHYPGKAASPHRATPAESAAGTQSSARAGRVRDAEWAAGKGAVAGGPEEEISREVLRTIAEVNAMRTLCPGCGVAVSIGFVACPHCGQRLGGACRECGRSLQPAWKFCPYCAAAVAVSDTRVPDDDRPQTEKTTLELPPSKKHGPY